MTKDKEKFTRITYEVTDYDGPDEIHCPVHCPRCGGDNLHHAAITTYQRREDAEKTLRTEVLYDHVETAIVDSDEPWSRHNRNPSSRRNGVTISFWCETCGDSTEANPNMELCVAQHKGSTYLFWRFIYRSG